jgi:hypothetical protein
MNNLKGFVIITVVIISYSCNNNIDEKNSKDDKKIEITSEYIINDNWNKIAKAIKVNKMKVKKDSVLIVDNNISQADLLNKLETDSSFIYYANVLTNKQSFKDVKIYFNRDNGFYWSGENSNDTTRIIGSLEKGNWYKFSHLVTYPYYVYVYLDSSNKVHRFDVNLANY